MVTDQQNDYHQALNAVNQALDQTKYSPYISPWTSPTGCLNVTVLAYIYKILALTNDKLLSVAMEVDLQWFDQNLPGNWSSLPLSNTINVDSSRVWTMNLYIQNPSTSNLYLTPTNVAYIIQHPGNGSGAIVQENIINEFNVICFSMSLVNFPFDSQSCIMSLAYYDRSSINFVFSGHPDFNSSASNSEWRLDYVTWANSSVYGLFSGSCMYGFGFEFTFTRNSYYYVVFLIVPTLLLQAISILAFILPSDQGEKIMLSATLNLAMYVLMTGLNVLIPQVEHAQTPKLLTALNFGFIMTALSLFESVLVQTIRIVASDLPDSVHHFVDKYICCKVFRRRPPEGQSASKPKNTASSSNSASVCYVSSTDIELNNSAEEVGGNGSTISIIGDGLKADAKSQCQCSSTLEALLRELLETCKRKERKRNLVDRSWRKVEYALNFTALVIYAFVFTHYNKDLIAAANTS